MSELNDVSKTEFYECFRGVMNTDIFNITKFKIVGL